MHVSRFQRIFDFSTLQPSTYFTCTEFPTFDVRMVKLIDTTVRVYKGDKCEGGWTLQPLGEGCSDVQAFGSIQLIKE
jgi:hypothetical protein